EVSTSFYILELQGSFLDEILRDLLIFFCQIFHQNLFSGRKNLMQNLLILFIIEMQFCQKCISIINSTKNSHGDWRISHNKWLNGIFSLIKF
ncbi:MAG: hypothetical protein AB2693_05040, partial [Candidatus Thiodiazotropha sp.]